MGLLIGTDEAGYGPNLGPLVITATAWSVPGGPKQFDFWSARSSVVSQQPDAGRLHVADSKQVYSPSKGLANLERSVLALLALRNWQPESLSELIRGLTDARSISEPLRLLNCEPWFEDADLELPFVVSPSDYEESAEKLRETCEADRIAFRSLATDVIFTERFNQLCERHGNKGAALSKSTLTLIRSQWDPDSGESTLIIGDKHGGRNRYDDLIDEQLDGQMIFRVTEGRDRSIYRVAGTELHFRQGAESHFPVAVSSMICKYVRELCLELFNRFWQQHLPNLKPTKGYPQDARRFRDEVDDVRQQLGIREEVFWRRR